MSNKGKKQFVKVGAMLQKKELDKQGRAAYYLKVDENTDLRINALHQHVHYTVMWGV